MVRAIAPWVAPPSAGPTRRAGDERRPVRDAPRHPAAHGAHDVSAWDDTGTVVAVARPADSVAVRVAELAPPPGVSMIRSALLRGLAAVSLLSSTALAGDLVDVASGNEDFETLVAAVAAAGLVDTLKGDGPFTVFAPTDAAFAKLPAGTVEELLKPENKDKLIAILTYHVVAGKVMAADVKSGKVTTVQGSEVKVKVKKGVVTVDGATVVATDVLAGNGVIHVIDTVILPD
jgi:uncharacterized surface protein with fasciclin (FAS1) repeats